MTFKKGIWKDCFLPRAELLVGLYWVAGYHYYFYIGNAFLTSISKGPEATLWIFHCNAVVSYVNDFINVSWKWNWFMQINLSHSLQDEKYKKWWNKLSGVRKHHWIPPEGKNITWRISSKFHQREERSHS